MSGWRNINLAGEPFRKDRAMLVAFIATAVLLAGVFGILLFLLSLDREEGAHTAQMIRQTRKQLATLSAEESRLQALLLRPENSEVLERSIFLNALLTRKGISWTLLFADLAKVLPYNVKLIQIGPRVAAGDEVQLDMVVGSLAGEPVIEMLKAMEGSDLFSSTAVSAVLPPTDTEPLYRYRVSVNYDRQL